MSLWKSFRFVRHAQAHVKIQDLGGRMRVDSCERGHARESAVLSSYANAVADRHHPIRGFVIRRLEGHDQLFKRRANPSLLDNEVSDIYKEARDEKFVHKHTRPDGQEALVCVTTKGKKLSRYFLSKRIPTGYVKTFLDENAKILTIVVALLIAIVPNIPNIIEFLKSFQ